MSFKVDLKAIQKALDVKSGGLVIGPEAINILSNALLALEEAIEVIENSNSALIVLDEADFPTYTPNFKRLLDEWNQKWRKEMTSPKDKKLFRVTATFTIEGYRDIEASDADEAETIASGLGVPDFHIDGEQLEDIVDIQELVDSTDE